TDLRQFRPEALVGNKGYRRFLMKPDDGHFAIDQAKAEEDAKFDGVFVLRTNAQLSPLEAMLVYKQLWTVDIDQTWRLSRIKGWRVWGNARKQGTSFPALATATALSRTPLTPLFPKGLQTD